MPDTSRITSHAETLIEALPYIRKYAGSTFVIKYGGHAMGNPTLTGYFAQDIVLLKMIGINPVVVHGGGPQIGKMLDRLGIKTRFINGLRVTDHETAKIAEMVLAGSINKEISGAINRAGGRAVGITGKDSKLVTARKITRNQPAEGSMIEQVTDLGFVGEPETIDTSVLDLMNKSNVIPVIAPVASDEKGDTYNINADTMAGAIAGAMKAQRLFLLSDVPGVQDKDGKLLTGLNSKEIIALIDDGTIRGGMIPKVKTCLAALDQGVSACTIIDGRVQHAILLEIFTNEGSGTLMRGKPSTSTKSGFA